MYKWLRIRRQKWVDEDCEFVYEEYCDACPYVVYDEFGRPKCDKKMKEKCESGEMDGDDEEE